MTETFGSLLREIRRTAGVSQRDLANKVNLDFSYISKLENDRIPPPAADTVVAICEVLNVEPDQLLSMTGKIPSKVQENLSKSRSAQEFLREAWRLNLTDDEWETMKDSLKGLRGEDS